MLRTGAGAKQSPQRKDCFVVYRLLAMTLNDGGFSLSLEIAIEKSPPLLTGDFFNALRYTLITKHVL